jgi:hypothetical protein
MWSFSQSAMLFQNRVAWLKWSEKHSPQAADAFRSYEQKVDGAKVRQRSESNRPLAPVHNNQRDGMARATINQGRVSYFPNRLGGGCPM